MYRRPCRLRENRGKFCSRSCRNKVHLNTGPRKPLPQMRGANNPAWKGGVTYRRRKGNYPISVKYVRCPAELMTMARKDGYVMEHRLIIARLAGRPLTRTEVVHHVDHNPMNNNPPNLELWPDNRSHKLAEHGRHVEGAANRVSLAA